MNTSGRPIAIHMLTPPVSQWNNQYYINQFIQRSSFTSILCVSLRSYNAVSPLQNFAKLKEKKKDHSQTVICTGYNKYLGISFLYLSLCTDIADTPNLNTKSEASRKQLKCKKSRYFSVWILCFKIEYKKKRSFSFEVILSFQCCWSWSSSLCLKTDTNLIKCPTFCCSQTSPKPFLHSDSLTW